MPASVAEFVQVAADSGTLAADVLAEYLQGVAEGSDATVLANRREARTPEHRHSA